MKKSIKIISLSVLITLFSGCEGKNFNLPTFEMPDISIPAFDVNQKKIDKNLPRLKNVKIRTSLSQVALEWTPIKDRQIAGYRILRSDGKGGFDLIKVLNDPYIAHYTDENFKQRLFNRYLISAYTTDGRVSMPSAINVPQNIKKIGPVPYITAVSGLPNRVKILWRIHPDLRVNSYVIQRATQNATSWDILTTVPKRLSVEYIDTDVQPGIHYRYRILAQTVDGLFSQASKEVSGTAKLLPSPVTGIMATTNLAKKIEVIWKPSPQPNALYHLYASDFADGVYSLVAKTKATHYTDKFDSDGVTRFYRVTIIDNDGLESSQNFKPIKGQTLGYLKAPNITSARVIKNTVELQWSKTDPRTISYIIYKKFWDGWRARSIKTVGFTGTTYIDHKIRPDITYTYYVVGVDKDGIPSESSRSVNLSVESMSQNNSWF